MWSMCDMMGNYHSAMIAQGSNITHTLETSIAPPSSTQVWQEASFQDWIEEAHTIFYDAEGDGDLTLEARLAIVDIFNTDTHAARGYVLL